MARQIIPFRHGLLHKKGEELNRALIVLNFIFSFNFTFASSVLIFSATYNPNYCYCNQCSNYTPNPEYTPTTADSFTTMLVLPYIKNHSHCVTASQASCWSTYSLQFIVHELRILVPLWPYAVFIYFQLALNLLLSLINNIPLPPPSSTSTSCVPNVIPMVDETIGMEHSALGQSERCFSSYQQNYDIVNEEKVICYELEL